ncbi:MAG: glycosyltransferase, partial [Paludibacter sp.]|nr:glycosyltransferase [Paludibacter sp.]
MHTISVVIPAYNASKYIVQCLEQIFNQTYKQLEVIVVDDGSTDNTSELASEYPVKLIQQVNQGVSVARYKGMEVATDDYLHFMDVDDLIALDFYLNMYDSICAVDADMTCCNV